MSELSRRSAWKMIRTDDNIFEEEEKNQKERAKAIVRQRRIERAYYELAELLNYLNYEDEFDEENLPVIEGKIQTVRVNPMTELFVNVRSQE